MSGREWRIVGVLKIKFGNLIVMDKKIKNSATYGTISEYMHTIKKYITV